jgi:hypothetical protein
MLHYFNYSVLFEKKKVRIKNLICQNRKRKKSLAIIVSFDHQSIATNVLISYIIHQLSFSVVLFMSLTGTWGSKVLYGL